MDETQTDALNELLKQSKLTVLSTVNINNKPESALVAFAEDKHLNLYFQTRLETRKYKNLQQNEAVSLVIGWEPDALTTVQLEGTAKPIKASDAVKQLFVDKKSPSTSEYLDHPEAQFYKVTMTWLRCSNYSTKPPTIWEYSTNGSSTTA